jgi:C-terminal processing protease CtpA/Prc
LRLRRRFASICLSLAALTHSYAADNQPIASLDENQRGRVLNMLHETVQTIRKNYYDPSLSGTELNDRAKLAEEKLEHSPNLSVAFGVIAWAVDGMKDSHTRFIPPMRPYRTDRGWTVSAVGNRSFVTAVRPGSDAEAQGLKPGDELLGMDGFRVTPDLLPKLEYAFDVIAPHSAHEIFVASPGSQPRKLTVKVEYIKMKQLLTSYEDYMELIRKWQLDEQTEKPRSFAADNVFVYQLPHFELTNDEVEDLFKQADKYKTLVLDLRGNPGGSVQVLTDMFGHVFDHEIKIGDQVTRQRK